MIDSTVVRAHQHSAGAQKAGEDQAIGRSRGGLSTKIHATVDALGNPTGFFLTGGGTTWLVPITCWRRCRRTRSSPTRRSTQTSA